MAKQPRTKMSGKEALYIIKQNNINQAWLAEKLGISPQSLTSRFHASEFSVARQLEINKAMGKRIFDVDVDIPDVQKDANRIPVFDMRVIGGFDIVAIDDTHDIPVAEYVTMAGLRGCVGLYVYGESDAASIPPANPSCSMASTWASPLRCWSTASANR